MVFNFNEFTGGYATDLPPERMEAKMLSISENMVWDRKYKSREGSSELATTDVSASILQGGFRGYLNSTWYTFLAVENASADVNIYYGLDDCGTLTAIDNTFDLSSGEFEFDQLGDYIVAVNGVDKPTIIYYDSGMTIKTLEANDVRTRGDSDWWAGSYTNSTGVYASDTDDAQSASIDFQYCNASMDGFFVAGAFTFNKIYMNDVHPAGSTDVTYQYYKGDDAWGTMDLVATPDFDGAGTADVSIEFNYPSTWTTYDGTATGEEDMTDRFVARVLFDTQAVAKSCGEIEISNTQYFSFITDDARSKHVWTHLSRLYLSDDNNVQYSKAERLTGWDEYDTEGFYEGGKEILAMRSIGDYLAIIKGNGIYGYFGNVFSNREVRFLQNSGTVNGRSCTVINGQLFYLAHDGVHRYADNNDSIVSKHIQSDIDSWTKTNACSVEYNGKYWLAFPSNDVVLWADPDTYRRDEMGDGRLSFYKLKGLTPKQMLWNRGEDDDDYLTAIQGTGIYRYQNDTHLDGTVDITTSIESKEYSFGEFQKKKRYTRAKFETSKIGTIDVSLYGEYKGASMDASIDTGTGTGHYSGYINVPYTIDGNNVAFSFTHTGSTDVVFYGVSLDAIGRKY